MQTNQINHFPELDWTSNGDQSSFSPRQYLLNVSVMLGNKRVTTWELKKNLYCEFA